jgi:hypothetical protein
MRLDGNIPGFGIAFRHVNNTVYAVTQPLREPEMVPAGVSLRVLSQKFVHD